LEVSPGGRTEVRELTVSSLRVEGAAPVSTSTLRRILVDRIVQAVMAEAARYAEGKVIDRADVQPGAYQLAGDPDDSVRLGAPKTKPRVAWAAQIYRSAMAAGSYAPTQTVAQELHVSRSQASRYVAEARGAGLLPQAPRPGRE
jgi:hypothetical protein